EAAFAFAPNVYLTKAVNVLGTEILVIKSGNHLHLGDFTVTVQDGGGIVTQNADGIAWGNGGITGASENKAYLIGPTGAFTDKAVTKLAQLPITADDATDVAYTEVDGRAIGATTTPSKAFNSTTGAAKAIGGTLTVLITDEFEVPNTHYSNAGSLAVTGNVTLAGTLAGVGGFDVYGNLTSNVADTAAGPVLVAGTLTARKITTKGGNFGGPVTIKSATDTSAFGGTQTTVTGVFKANGPVEFSDSDATFTAGGTLSAATFGGDVTFTTESTIDGKAVFANGKKVVGKVAVTGQVSAGATGTNTLLLAPNGHIIYTGGVQNSFLTGANNVGTLAALDEAGTLTFSIGANELAVSGAGSFVIGNPITLSSGKTIKVDGTTGVYFSATEGKIKSDTYELGGVVGTLSDSNGAVGGFTLTENSIINTADNGSASLKYVGKTNAADSIILNVLYSKALTISNVNIDLNEETAGSISLGGGSASIILTGAGSITTGADTTNTLAWGGKIFTDYVASGSLVSGSVGYGEHTGSIAAGSIGTAAGNFITQNGSFAILSVAQDDILKAVGSAGTNPDDELSAAKGSIAVFQISE
ncbi:MAG: hypothetical protein LBJ86_04155, partial [Spirochaetaceae bacterium]|nr:hypothetical protein [Spirochaetaceae bacterium]